MIPRATYRLQFHKDFAFARAAALADYFAELGISHIYASPILTARAGSTHGYNVVDFSRINPELGGEAEFRKMEEALRARDIGIIVDIVPNHMAVGKADNPWWLDVLRNGRASSYAAYFDIDWDALDGKILAPFLDGAPERLLERGDLKLTRDDAGMAFVYFDHRFPISPSDEAQLSGTDLDTLSPHDKRVLLSRQHYALADWREADARINWRRFFDINELAGLRMENDAAFEAVHAKTLALYAQGLIDGLRVDHIDGLADPRAYCRKLRARLEDCESARPPERQRGGAYLIVEKILGHNETLPDDWLVDGTTGYDFMEDVSALLHAGDHGALARLWSALSGRSADFESEERLARGEILGRNFAALCRGTAHAMHAATSTPADTIENGVAAITTALRCYRTYATGKSNSPSPGPCFDAAVADIRSDVAVRSIEEILRSIDDKLSTIDAVRRFNQLAAPVAAKAVEDTAFYRYGRLLSRNDVGFDPRIAGISSDEFHRRVAARASVFPHAMLTTATHDHKRGEDARARLAVLSEIPALWQGQAEIWLARAPAAIDQGDAYQLLQTLVGVWPLEPSSETSTLAERVETWCVKFLREAKLRSTWASPDLGYEKAFASFARTLISDDGFRRSTDRFIAHIAPQAIANSLVHTVLRTTVPGTPDLYQGRERWDFSLVDPDNRTAVDYAIRARSQKLARPLVARPESWRDGTLKQALTTRLLNARRQHAELLQHGTYQPIAIQGPRAANVIAFLRRSGPRYALIAVALRCGEALLGHDEIVPPTAWWGDTELKVDFHNPHGLSDVLADTMLAATPTLVADLFEVLPVAVLVSV
jgi:(1->4)-alpha-D-glucan 1-alpha-D-glucosylmutase